jgi:hypothetical protein
MLNLFLLHLHLCCKFGPDANMFAEMRNSAAKELPPKDERPFRNAIWPGFSSFDPNPLSFYAQLKLDEFPSSLGLVS